MVRRIAHAGGHCQQFDAAPAGLVLGPHRNRVFAGDVLGREAGAAPGHDGGGPAEQRLAAAGGRESGV